MRITSEKAFIQKINQGYKLDKAREFKRTLYYLKNKSEEIIVAISLIRKLEAKGIVDSNWDVHLPKKTSILHNPDLVVEHLPENKFVYCKNCGIETDYDIDDNLCNSCS
jgi:hypothetical protein